MRLIDADKITGAKFHDLPYTHIVPRDVESESYMLGWNDAIDAIVEVEPTIDAVEVVRCRDCKYQNKGENESESWNLCGYRPWLYIPTSDDHFCGYGERGEADDE